MDSKSESSLPHVLILDDDPQIINLMKIHTRGKANIIAALTIDEAWEKLKQEKVHIIISDQNLSHGEYGSDFLREIKKKHPEIRRVIVTSDDSIDIAVTSVNEASIQGYILKPWKKSNLLSIIEGQYKYYIDAEKEKERLLSLRNDSRHLRRRLLEHSTSLVKKLKTIDSPIEDADLFINFTAIIENYLSIMENQVNEFVNSNDKKVVDELLSTISEVVMFANQYHQEKLFLLVQLIRGYLWILLDQFQRVNQIVIELQIRTTLRPRSKINDELSEQIQDFILLFTNIDYENPAKNNRGKLIARLKELVRTPAESLLTMTEDLPRILQHESVFFDYFFVIRGSITLFSYKSSKLPGVNPVLIGNFIQALEEFFETALNSEGKLESVTHENGSLIFWRSGSIYYVFITRSRSYYHRIALRKIGEETIDIVKSIPENEGSNEKVEREIMQRLKEFFSI